MKNSILNAWIERLRLTSRILVLVSAIVFVPLASAAESSLYTDGETKYRFVPYLWTAGLDADVGLSRRPISVDVSFSDYIEFIDAGAAFVFEAIGPKWSFISNVMYVEMSEGFDLPATTIDYENKQLILEVGGGYRPEKWKEGRILGGVRYMSMDNNITFLGSPGVDIDGDWADPFIGLEWRPRRGKWEYSLEADIGGGVDADFSWQVLTAFSYHFSDRHAITAGYRFLDIDFDDDEFIFDGTMEGIQVGWMFKF